MTATRPEAPPRTPLAEVALRLGVPPAEGTVPTDGADPVVTGVTMNSRLVQPGDLYVASPGASTHGARFAAAAAASGAVAVLTDRDGAAICRAEGLTLPVLEVERPRAVVGTLAAWLYGDPAERLALVAVTGTQGKTTTTRLAEAALEVAGVPAGVVGTIGTRVAGEAVTSMSSARQSASPPVIEKDSSGTPPRSSRRRPCSSSAFTRPRTHRSGVNSDALASK